ncbi:MAG: cyclomaltodextrinase [Solobacterium sp.]|nr:cyclomaltodextrinase [Solobacterium sp.]
MNFNSIVYQIYPFGFCGTPKENNGIRAHSIRKVIDWIPHLQKLGITDVLFNPVFESDRHGYDTRDYSRIDCRLGTNDDFREVCGALHDAGMSVILDGIYNHVGRGFFAFQDVLKYRYDSRYKDWFFINFGDSWNSDSFSYADWEGHHELVKLNLRNEEVRRYLLESTDRWISEFHIDGLRLDVAYMVDRDFMRELTAHVRAYDPDFFFLGEMIGGDYNVLLKECRLDSVTNYECRKGLYSSMNSRNLFEIGYSLNRQFGNDPWTLYRGEHLLSFADNHDVDRIASSLQDQRDLPLTYSLMFAMPGIPCIYYGSEWGTEGKRDRHSDDALRPCFEKPQWNSLCDHIAALCRMRRKYPVFTDGSYTQIYIRNEQLIFQRKDRDNTLLFAVNIADAPHTAYFEAGTEEALDLVSGTKKHFGGSAGLEAKSAYFWISN